MRCITLALLLLTPSAVFAASKPDPADFTVTVHVIASSARVQNGVGVVSATQVLETTIDNQPVELTGYSAGVLPLGDYKARIATSIHGPHNPNSYDIYKGYDLLMPDGTARTYTVTRIGPAPTNP
jgi:hypothetical protein